MTRDHKPAPTETLGPGIYVARCTCGKWLVRVTPFRKPFYWRHAPRQ